MTIVGRITKDAVVNSTKNSRKVVNVSLAINERYKPKEGVPVKVTTYCNCSVTFHPLASTSYSEAFACMTKAGDLNLM